MNMCLQETPESPKTGTQAEWVSINLRFRRSIIIKNSKGSFSQAHTHRAIRNAINQHVCTKRDGHQTVTGDSTNTTMRSRHTSCSRRSCLWSALISALDTSMFIMRRLEGLKTSLVWRLESLLLVSKRSLFNRNVRTLGWSWLWEGRSHQPIWTKGKSPR